MKRLARLKKNAGAAYFDTIFSVFIIMLVLAAFMTFVPVFMQKYQLDMAAEDIARMISVSGQTDVSTAQELSEKYGLNIDDVEVTADADSITSPASSGGSLIQLSGGFKVTLTSHRTVGIGGIVPDMDIGLSSSARGRSEVYWKSLA